MNFPGFQPAQPPKQNTFQVMSHNIHGEIIPDGMEDPEYVMDCMAYGYMDDKTGRWDPNKAPPPREYFNCLRYLQWRESGGGYPIKIRDISLKPPGEVPDMFYEMAMNMSYGLWAERRLVASGIPVDMQMQLTVDELASLGFNVDIMGPRHLAGQSRPVDPLAYSAMPFPQPQARYGHAWPSATATTISQPVPFSSSPELADQAPAAHAHNADAPLGPAAWMKSQNWRTDSVMTSSKSGSSSPTLTFKDDIEDSPTHRPSRRNFSGGQLSALAPNFNYSSLSKPQPNAALTSKAALPQPAGQLPGTFDVLSSPHKNFTILRVTDSPFNVTVNEILTHLKLGEREGLVNYGTDNPGIHIIQDRADSKTHEVYIEMLDFQAAQRVLTDIPKRGLKVGSTGGSRKIKVEMVGQDVMIKAIFPRPTRAHPRDFNWIGDKPDLSSMPNPFIGYVTSEDLHNAREWAEHPRKAKHADDSPQRVYEFMISTLLKLPQDSVAYPNLKGWSYDEFVDRLFATVRIMIQTLNHFIDDAKYAERHLPPQYRHMLNFRLLKRLNQTAYDFPLFTPVQKQMLLQGQI